MTGAPIIAAIETGGTRLLYRVAVADGKTLGEGRFDTGRRAADGARSRRP